MMVLCPGWFGVHGDRRHMKGAAGGPISHGMCDDCLRAFAAELAALRAGTFDAHNPEVPFGREEK